MGDYSAYQDALGVKAVTWSPSGQFLAVGSYDQAMRLINNVTWKKISEHECVFLQTPRRRAAVQFHPHGGQIDFVWLSARTPHGAYVW